MNAQRAASSPGGFAQPRKAALMAHAMTPGDQAWLLAALAPTRRRALEDLLAELRELGIPADPALLQALEEPYAPASGAPPAADPGLGRLSAAQVRKLAGLLSQESPQLTARLLAMRPWPWRGALLNALGPAYVRRLGVMPARSDAPALQAAVCAVVLEALGAAEPARSRGAVDRVRQAARSWLRLRRERA